MKKLFMSRNECGTYERHMRCVRAENETQISRIAIVLICILISINVSAQKLLNDTLFIAEAQKKAIENYSQSIAERSLLYSGREYYDFGYTLTGHQFFGGNKWVEGSINYCDKTYDNVKLKYDLVNDLIIMAPYAALGGEANISLINEKIDWFSINGNKFVKLFPDSVNKLNREGFYEIMYNGGVKVYALRDKKIDEYMTSQEVVRKVTLKSKYYIAARGEFYRIQWHFQVYNLFNEEKNQLKKFKKSQRLDFENNFEYALLKLVEYYDTLSEKEFLESKPQQELCEK